MSTSPSSRVAPFAIVGAAALWGTTGTAASFFPENVSPLAIGAVTMVGGGILLFFARFHQSRAALRERALRPWLLLGAVGVFVYPLAFYSSMDLAGIAVGNVVSLGTGPVFAALLERVIERRRLSMLWKITTSLALAGIVLLTIGGGNARNGGGGESLVAGVMLGLLAGVSYALYTYCSTRVIRAGHTSGATMGAIFGVGALGLLPVLAIFGGPLVQSGVSIGTASYLIIGPMFIAYILFGIGLRATSSSTATTIALLEPVVATLLAVIIVGELLAPLSWAGLALIFLAVSVLSTARHPRNQQLST
ncbi:DME family drug/metabolite transporter [Rhodoglobus vestalii]|uniref:DME family drug/metabolite transporter n=1 Tax=Rhodoglobus vestalii TaxID=193384 RepID=A0A8H2PV15_9MICO|nr:EamA family transporter [Rhodoglobus vestalii]TQO21171.1 DME family drug/metabolite transporter [Rhodoglobus vestalii]